MEGPKSKREWSKGSIEGAAGIMGRVEEGRSLASYMEDLGMTDKDIDGKRILDLGAAPDGKFEKEVGERAFVVSLSPDYALPEHVDRLEPSTKAVAALGQEMPFQDGEFDQVLMYHVTEHVTNEQFLDILKDAARVLRAGGTIRIMPIHPFSDFASIAESFAQEQGLVMTLEKTERTIRFDPWGDGFKQRYELERITLQKKLRKRKT